MDSTWFVAVFWASLLLFSTLIGAMVGSFIWALLMLATKSPARRAAVAAIALGLITTVVSAGAIFSVLGALD